MVQKEQSKEIEESRKGEKKKEISVMTSKFNQTRVYQRFGSSANKLESMPDYSNSLIKEKQESFRTFTYDKPELEVPDAHNLGPLEF